MRAGEAGISTDPGGGICRTVGQYAGEVEAKPVHAICGVPQGQGIEDELLGETGAIRKVDIVAGAAGVGEEPVPGAAIDLGDVVAQIVALVDEASALDPVAFGGVVVDRIHEHRDAAVVECLDEPLQLNDLVAGSRRIARFGREEVCGHVPPVIHPARRCRRLLVVLHDRHQLDRGDAELGEVIYPGGQAARCFQLALRQTGIGAAQRRRQTRKSRRVILHVQLINDKIFGPYLHMARSRIGAVIVDHAFAASGIDGVVAVDEGRREVEFRIADLLRTVGVRVVEHKIAVQHGAKGCVRRGGAVTIQAVHVKRAGAHSGAAYADAPVACTVRSHRHDLRRCRGVSCVVDQQFGGIGRGRA